MRCRFHSLRFFLVVAALVVGFCPLQAQAQQPRPFVVEDPPRSAQDQLETFHLPAGFQIELIASEPEVVNPINLNFDASGSLYVSQSVEYPIPAPLDRPGRDKILRIDDANGDGVPDSVKAFASGLNIPIGVTPVPGGVLGFSVPSVYFFDNGEETVSRWRKRFGDFGFDDTHGMVSSLTWWIDGWVYGCHGFVNTSQIAGSDGQSIKMVSGNTYRLKPDGSRIEHYAHGQVNPFGLAIDPWGNVFTSDCHTRPATMLLPGAHYPRSPGDGLGLGPELMQHSHGSTGIAGIVYYAAEQFPVAYRGSLFIGNPITGRINWDQLERYGSTYTAIEQKDFLTCDDFWFRPVDMQLGPDGALYIADMYNCIIGHYEVPLNHPKRDRTHGRIWRVSYVGASGERALPSNAKDLTKETVDGLLDRLADPNLMVRTHTTHQLVERIGAACVEPLRAMMSGDATETQRAHGLWVLQRLGELRLDDWRPRIDDASPLVRLHAVKVLAEASEWHDATARAVLERLNDEDGFVRRAAVHALARHPQEDAVEALLTLLRKTDAADGCLIHAARMSLRDTLREFGGFDHWEEHAESTERLQQLADVAVGIGSPPAAEFLWHRFLNDEYPPTRRSDVLRHVVRHINEEMLPDVLALADTYVNRDEATQIAVAAAIHRGSQERGLKIAPKIRQWGERLVRPLLTSDDAERVRQGVELASQMRLSGLAKELSRLCVRETPVPAERLAAIQTMLAVAPVESVPLLFAIVRDEFEAPGLRQIAAEQLANRKNTVIRKRILTQLPTDSHLIAVGFARGLIMHADGANALLDLVEQGKVSPRVLQDAKIQRLLPASGLENADSRTKKLVANLPSLDAQTQRLIQQRQLAFRKATPDMKRGAEIFLKTCAACHRLDNQGESVGPELDGVGQRGAERLLEDILDPNRGVDKNYRTTLVETQAGQVLTGLVTGQEGQVLLLVDQTGKLQRIPLTEVDERQLIEGSPMPSNFGDTLTEAELNDLLSFLLSKTVETRLK